MLSFLRIKTHLLSTLKNKNKTQLQAMCTVTEVIETTLHPKHATILLQNIIVIKNNRTIQIPMSQPPSYISTKLQSKGWWPSKVQT